jgi:hypothetical protein
VKRFAYPAAWAWERMARFLATAITIMTIILAIAAFD